MHGMKEGLEVFVVERPLRKGFRLTFAKRRNAMPPRIEETFQGILRSELRRVTRSDSTTP